MRGAKTIATHRQVVNSTWMLMVIWILMGKGVRGVGCLQWWLVKVMTTMAAECFLLTMLRMMMTL